jgi:putative Mg2+ transporter-C (MgtC) family protein
MGGWWSQFWEAMREDFSDLSGAAAFAHVILRILLAALLGGFLGFEREEKGKAAGLRTYMLVTLGSAFFVLVAQQAGMASDGVSRVLQGLLAGIGFIGAGTILKQDEKGRIKGLTTAAGLWMTAAVGVAVGLGHIASAFLATASALLVMYALGKIERWLEKKGGPTAS